jgi:hypothetical protein
MGLTETPGPAPATSKRGNGDDGIGVMLEKERSFLDQFA